MLSQSMFTKRFHFLYVIAFCYLIFKTTKMVVLKNALFGDMIIFFVYCDSIFERTQLSALSTLLTMTQIVNEIRD